MSEWVGRAYASEIENAELNVAYRPICKIEVETDAKSSLSAGSRAAVRPWSRGSGGNRNAPSDRSGFNAVTYVYSSQ